MIGFTKMGSNAADAITGDRIMPGETVFDTGIRNRPTPYMNRTKTRFIKEATIVWLAEQAGYDVVKRVAGDSGSAEVVDATDVGSGDGETAIAEAPVGGSKPAKRRANGATKGK